MKTRKLGHSDLEVSVIGLGANNFGGRLDLTASRAVIDKALDVGITLIDTADVYGETKSEAFIGEALGARRKDVVLATKFGMRRGAPACASRAYIVQAVEASLARLKTDYIDLYQQHQPDPATPIEETLRALEDLIQQGKVRYVGNSNFAAWQTVDADWTARTLDLSRFVSCQDEYNFAKRGIEAELLPAIRAKGLSLLPYFPLASGLFSGKYRKGAPIPAGARLDGHRAADKILTDANFALVEALDAFAQSRSHTILELAFAWLLSEPALASVIAGATKPEQVEANAKAADWTLSPEDLAELRELLASPRP